MMYEYVPPVLCFKTSFSLNFKLIINTKPWLFFFEKKKQSIFLRVFFTKMYKNRFADFASQKTIPYLVRQPCGGFVIIFLKEKMLQ